METRRATMDDPLALVNLRPEDVVLRLGTLLDAFVTFAEREAPEGFGCAVSDRFQGLATELGGEGDGRSLRALFPNAGALQSARLEYVGRLLGIADGDPEGDHGVTRLAATQARLLPAYHQMRVLCDLVGDGKGIPLVEAFVDEWMSAHTKADATLEDPSRFWDALEGEHDGTDEIAGRLHRGRILFRVERCLWADVLKPLGDPALAHAGTCYGDFAQISAIHPSFVLTRTMTLMQGDPYCDTCIHDTRHVDSIEHPSREVFDSLGTDG